MGSHNKEAGGVSWGYLIVRHEADGNYIDYLADISDIASQTVEFGKNLLDITQKVSGDEMVTGIIPLGFQNEETKERLTIASVNDEKDYLVNTEQAEKFGYIFKTVVWDDVTIAENLKAKGEADMSWKSSWNWFQKMKNKKKPQREKILLGRFLLFYERFVVSVLEASRVDVEQIFGKTIVIYGN